MYDKLSGMTGTADTEAEEFNSIYNLEVIVAPTNKEMVRDDCSDLIYRTEQEKFDALIEEIRGCNESGQPVLVGTISIEKSEQLSHHLKKYGIKHNVLNAKHHEKEAEIISQAGQIKGVTIATNMAGRGTDIVLGEGVSELGGLHITGTERHESRRIDNQLRGRSGRQGDPGSSRFYLSLEDDLMRIFGSEKISGIMEKLGMENGQPIEHPMVSKAVANAQKKVEAHNFDIRKHLLEYDDVMNKQREVFYGLRREILNNENHREMLLEMAEELVSEVLADIASEKIYPEEWDIEALDDYMMGQFSVPIKKQEGALEIGSGLSLPLENCDREKLHNAIMDSIQNCYAVKERGIDPSMMRQLEKMIMLQVVDNLWKEHLLGMDHLKDGVGLRGYAQKNPLTEYKKEGFEMFSIMMHQIREGVTEYLFKVQIEEGSEFPAEQNQSNKMVEHRGASSEESRPSTVRRDDKKLGRNDPCHCGSGKKFKKCHGK